MRTFAQKPKATQQTTSAKPTIPGRAHFGQSREVHSSLQLQSTIGNQAGQRMLQTNAEEPEVGLTGTASPRFGHDFSRIPIHSPAAARVIQTKLAINKPGDEYEQEADRISEQVMRMPEPQLQRACACGGACPKCQTEQPGHGHERLHTKRVGSGDWGKTEVPPIVHEVLRSSGQSIDLATRAFMEPRFGRDFNQIRVHTDAKAADSARAVNALAYTVGRDVVFGTGRYAPGSSEGQRLLAHELAHVVQQESAPRAPRLQRAWNACADAQTCPERERGETERARTTPIGTTLLESPVRGIFVYPFAIGSSDASALAADPAWQGHVRMIETGNSPWEILGLSDCDGNAQTNLAIRQARATAVLNELSPLARQSVAAARALPLGDCVGDDLSEEDRGLNRSVVLVSTVAPVTALTCPPAIPIRAATISDYISLVLCVEHLHPAFSPREILSLLRQFYYGSAAWSVHGPPQWDQIIPCGLHLPDPRPVWGPSLVASLRDSQEVAGVDIGHVFTGLEAMVCPRTSVTPRVNPPRTPEVTPDVPTIEVHMANEFLATWGGDIGAAAEERANEAIRGNAIPPWPCYFGGPGTSCPRGSLQASFADLEGDVDAFVIRAGLAGQSCAATELQPLPPLHSPLSQLLQDYYDAAPNSARARRNDYARCFLTMLGASLTSDSIANKDEVVDRIFPWVLSFARAARMGRTRWPDIAPPDATIIEQYSREVCQLFADWLETKL